MHVGDVIKKIRQERRLTLLELTQKSGVALATLSRIENGKMTGTLHSHINIANALDISLPDLYKDLAFSKKLVEVKQKKSSADVFIHDKNPASEILSSRTANKKMLPLMINIAKSASTQAEESKPGTEKFVYVLEGKIEASIGEDNYALAKGDTCYFNSSVTHSFKNTGNGEARIICVICPVAM